VLNNQAYLLKEEDKEEGSWAIWPELDSGDEYERQAAGRKPENAEDQASLAKCLASTDVRHAALVVTMSPVPSLSIFSSNLPLLR
jgi:hypothetical protein